MGQSDRIEQSAIAGQTVIAILLRNPEKMAQCDISREMFWNHTDGLIFATMRDMCDKKIAFDVISLTEKLLELTGQMYLDILTRYATESCGSAVNFKTYCDIIKNNYRKHTAIEIARQLINNVGDANSVELAISALMGLTSEDKTYEYDLAEAMKLGIRGVKERFENKGLLLGVDTGIHKLNEAIGGFNNSDLIVLAARPAMGKTALVLNMILKARAMVGFVSAEQGINQIIDRMMCISGGVTVANMRSGRLTDADWAFLEAGATKIKNHPGCHFYDKSSPSIQDVESLARRWVYDYGIKALYIDYIQRLQVPAGGKKFDVVAENTRRLKDLARELNIPIIVLAQVKRDVESRSDKRPSMGDISDSSEIEKEADVVITMYRDEYYNPETMHPGVIELNIEKNRHGPTGCIPTKWTSNIMRVSDMHENYER